ncbi:MAG TPA: Flp pilus assembly protein CpaB [Terrimesophilobacter sp.]|nr:Flp pilus assembly protein CpaB [Terrimesophilobacter sp.]
MKRSNRLVILVGVLLAILAFVLVVVLLNQTPPESAEPTEATVLVATEDIAIGDPVTPDKVEARTVPLEAASADSLADPSQVSGQPALFAIPADSQVTKSAIGAGGSAQCISCQLNPGEKAIAFQVDRTTGLDFLVQPGDNIDVVVSEEIQVLQETADSVQARLTDPDLTPRFEAVTGLESARTVKAVLQNKRVLYVSDSRIQQQAEAEASPAPEGQPAPAATPIENVIIVFAGTDADAEVIKFAQRDLSEIGALTAVVRSADDDAVEETLGVTIDALVERYGLSVPGIVNLEQLPETP